MATLSPNQKRKATIRKIRFTVITFVLSLFTFPYAVYYVAELFRRKLDYANVKISYLDSYLTLVADHGQQKLLLLLYGVYVLLIFMLFTQNMNAISRTETFTVAGKIELPIAVGEGQHGKARFLKTSEIKQIYCCVTYDGKHLSETNQNLGLVLGMKKEGNKEIIICISDDRHVIILGASRSGKSRREVMETIWLRSLCDKSMIINDPKGDSYIYFYPKLLEMGYDVYTFDLNQPKKSMHYNYLNYIVQAANEGDIPQTIDYTWDLVSVLVGEPKGEPLWTDGTAATIAACILVVVLQADLVYRNLTNVSEFIHHMCKSDACGDMPINHYFESLPDNHPAKMVFGAAEISPDKMRGSFFGSALTTLRLFTDWNIAEMTSQSDFDLKDIGRKKSALFIIIPDEKRTRYPLASLFISQAYIALTEVARKNGNRLPVPVDFILDEFGNCPAIPGFGTMMSVGAGRGIRFYLVLQSYQQLEKTYKDDHENIKDNCQTTVYLKCPNQKTLEELSKRTDTYTVQANSASSQASNKSSGSSVSSGANMVSRPLLFPGEVGRIESPYTLIFNSGDFPAILHTPDLSSYYINKKLGLGNEKHNQKLFMERDSKREEREVKPPELWGIWNETGKDSQEEKSYSFLDS